MKMHFRKAAAFVLAAILSAGVFSGCSINLNPADSQNPAMVVCGEKVYLDEVKLYVYMSQYGVEERYHEMLLPSYETMEKFWIDNNYWQSTQFEGPGKIYQTKLLLKYAQKNGITLTADEKAAAQKAYQDYKAKAPKVFEYADNPSEETAQRVFEENALANKVYQNMIKDVDKTFNDDEMLRKTFEGIYVLASAKKPVVKTETESSAEAPSESSQAAEEGEPYTEEEQKEAREAALARVYNLLRIGKTLDEIVKTFEGDVTVSVYKIDRRSISKTQAETSTSSYPYYALAWDMKTGDYKKEILETSSGTLIGYALHMLNDDDADARKTAEETELRNRENEAFKTAYADLLEKYSDMHVYEAKTSAISYKGDAYPIEYDEPTSETETESAQASK